MTYIEEARVHIHDHTWIFMNENREGIPAPDIVRDAKRKGVGGCQVPE
jgi:hypothetical protein